MARGVKNEKTIKSNAQKKRRNWEKFERGELEVYNKDHEKLVLEEGEKFIDIFQYDTSKPNFGKRDSYYKVSTHGNVISFKSGKALWLKAKPKEKYLVVDGWNLQRLVWFSFAAEAIEGRFDKSRINIAGIELPDTLEGLTEIIDKIEVHHGKVNAETQNTIDGLYALTNGTDGTPEIHNGRSNGIHALQFPDTEEQNLKNLEEIDSMGLNLPTRIEVSQDNQVLTASNNTKLSVVDMKILGYVYETEKRALLKGESFFHVRVERKNQEAEDLYFSIDNNDLVRVKPGEENFESQRKSCKIHSIITIE